MGAGVEADGDAIARSTKGISDGCASFGFVEHTGSRRSYCRGSDAHSRAVVASRLFRARRQKVSFALCECVVSRSPRSLNHSFVHSVWRSARPLSRKMTVANSMAAAVPVVGGLCLFLGASGAMLLDHVQQREAEQQ